MPREHRRPRVLGRETEDATADPFKMDILFLTMQFGPEYDQGAERYVRNLASYLRSVDHRVWIAGGDPMGHREPSRVSNLVPDESGFIPLPRASWMTVRGGPQPVCTQVLERLKPDLAHMVHPGTLGISWVEAARQAAVPVVATMVDFWWLCPKNTLLHYSQKICTGSRPAKECARCIWAGDPRSLRRSIGGIAWLPDTVLLAGLLGQRWVRGLPIAEMAAWSHRRDILQSELRQLDGVILLSQFAEKKFRPLLGNRPFRTIPVGLDTTVFTRQPDKNPRRRNQQLVVGFAGALAPHKGPHLLLEALQSISTKRIQVRLAGPAPDPDYLAQLKALAQGLPVTFLGPQSAAEMPEFYAGLDLLVVPSMWPENQPQVVLEAQMMQLHVIASNVPGIGELIQNEEMLFEVGSADSLAVVLQRFYQRRPSPPRTELRSVADMGRETEAFYHALL